ncbi:MAG: AlbA family DNA-binding domain-containing protein [Thermodesulfobacteriota bacterium]
MIDQSRIQKLIQSGEGLNLEFKKSRDKLNQDVYQTICAFLNRYGGTLLLGVHDSGRITGIDPSAVPQIKKDFVTTINNPQKIHPPAYLSVEEVQVQDQAVLHVYVPESSQVHRCNGRIYDRNEDGDLDITDHTRLVSELYARKQATYSENKVYPYAGLDDLRPDLIDKCRRLAGVWRDGHPGWIWMTWS